VGAGLIDILLLLNELSTGLLKRFPIPNCIHTDYLVYAKYETDRTINGPIIKRYSLRGSSRVNTPREPENAEVSN
jgi:hypothetical protein